jgi:Protein of unknown function (DUF3011)
MTTTVHSNSQGPVSGQPVLTALAAIAIVLSLADISDAQSPVASGAASPAAATVSCVSKAGERIHCAADTSAGVVLQQQSSSALCLLGKSWGYDDKGVWVSDGCGGLFQLGQSASQGRAPVPAALGPDKPFQPIEQFGEFTPGDGFLVGRSSAGELSVSGYALVRYMNQMPDEDAFTDHLGNERPVDGRNDIYSHRIMVFFKGWLGSQKLIYAITFWTVNTTDQRAIFANLGYQFNRKFSVYGGLNGLPGTRSLQGSHPFWLGNDRVMADEFFRPFFGSGVWAQGEILPGLWYNTAMLNNSSSLGVKSSQLDRTFSSGVSVWWMPTTHEFGPKGAYGDWEMHEKVATRFGFSTSRSPEQRFANTGGTPDNTTIRLADSVNVFETGALASGVTIDSLDYRILAFDAGVKYKGIFLQTELYTRWLDGFVADGPLPVSSVLDKGFYVQAAAFPVPKKLELYAATSQIFGDKDAGFSNSSEYLGGMNYYPMNTRNHRLNVQVVHVDKSPVSSAFGYYVGGQRGITIASAFSVYF